LPVINSHKLELLDDSRLIAQIAGLERRTARGGRDSIDHAPGTHDDLANATAGLVAILSAENDNEYDTTLSWVSGPHDQQQFHNPYAAIARRTLF
jgi:hypothetical protein